MFGFFKKKKKEDIGGKSGFLSVIILCAGNSTRFGSSKDNKQLTNIYGKSVAQRTIEVFNNTKSVKEIVVVVRKEDVEQYKDLISSNSYTKVKAIVTGGASRQISALHGLKHISEKARYVAVHDGARCLITEEMIEEVFENAVKYGAATAAYPVVDTIKTADKDGFVKKTLDRDFIWHIQTPQIFERTIYEKCSENAKQKGYSVTDDCRLAEILGIKVKLVNTGDENIKITLKSDIKKAELILRQREHIL